MKVFDALNAFSAVSVVAAGIQSIHTNCFTLGTDATWYGYESASFGTVSPDTASSGQFFYAFKYKATGEFEMRFGVAGDEQLPDTSEIRVINKSGSYSEILAWNSVAAAYTATDVTAATYLITLSDICLGFYALPETFIHYDFATTETA